MNSENKFTLLIFGSTSNVGAYLVRKVPKNFNIIKISRDNLKGYIKFDLRNPEKFEIPNGEIGIVSCAPIWIFSEFLKFFYNKYFYFFKKVKFVISLSSTSAITKKFSSNLYDLKLSSKLLKSENEISKICDLSSINNLIIRPSIIYGKYINKDDRNFSLIIKIMRKLPIVFLPACTGMRQPIHYSQLSETILFFIRNFIDNNTNNQNYNHVLEIGGDEEISYEIMLKRIINNLDKNDKARNCIVLKIPNRLYSFLLAPLLLFKPNTFYSFQRISSNLSGFNKVHKVIFSKKKNFPLKSHVK